MNDEYRDIFEEMEDIFVRLDLGLCHSGEVQNQ
jgi:hypothetical protein